MQKTIEQQVARGVADALDRLGVTVVALSVIGTWFTDQITVTAGIVGVFAGSGTVLLAVYNKVSIDAEEEETP